MTSARRLDVAGAALLRRGLASADVRRSLALAAGLLVALLATLVAVGCAGERPARPRVHAVDVGPAGSAFVPSSSAAPAVVWAVGDGPDGGPRALRVARLIAADPRLERMLYLGDTYGSADNWSTRFHAAYGRLAGRIAPTPGNHDWPAAAPYYLRYWQRATGRRVPSFYAFRVAGWELLSLNSEDEHGRGSPQERWLRRQVARGGNCRIAFWHRPRFSASPRHGDQADLEPLWAALRGRARLVLSGHDHDMQRLRPVGGLVQLVAGAGGHSRYPVDHDDPRLVFADDDHDGALRLELHRGVARFAFVAADGRRLHRGSVRCRPPGA